MKKSKLSRRERSLVAAAEERGYQQSQVEHGDIEAFNELSRAGVPCDAFANRDRLVAPVRALIAHRNDFRKGIVEVHDALSAAGVNGALASGVTELAGMRDAQRRRAVAADKHAHWGEESVKGLNRVVTGLRNDNIQLEAEVAALRAALALIDGIANREVLNTNAAKAILVGVANALPDAMRAAIVSAAELPLAVGLLAKAAKEKGAKP